MPGMSPVALESGKRAGRELSGEPATSACDTPSRSSPTFDPPVASLGQARSTDGARARGQDSSPRDPHPGSSLDPGALALLATIEVPYDPRASWQLQPPRDRGGLTQDVSEISSIRSARMILAAASIRARWEKAWGKLPRWRPVSVSNSSA